MCQFVWLCTRTDHSWYIIIHGFVYVGYVYSLSVRLHLEAWEEDCVRISLLACACIGTLPFLFSKGKLCEVSSVWFTIRSADIVLPDLP